MATIEGIVSPAYTVCVPGALIDAQFAAVLFKHGPVVHLFRRYSQGLVDDTLSLKFHEFAQIKVRIPATDEQRAIAEVFALVDRELTVISQLQQALDQQHVEIIDGILSGEFALPAS